MALFNDLQHFEYFIKFFYVIACVRDGSGALFCGGFFCRHKKSGNVQPDPPFSAGHAQINAIICNVKRMKLKKSAPIYRDLLESVNP
jgi:hypothetical protein